MALDAPRAEASRPNKNNDPLTRAEAAGIAWTFGIALIAIGAYWMDGWPAASLAVGGGLVALAITLRP